MNTLTLPHEELMQEESLKFIDLPQDIREDIAEIEELKGEYREYPSETGKNELIRESIAIADTIQDWLERDLPDDDENIVDNIESNDKDFQPTWKFW
jgi:hypothetical protein